MPSWPLRATSGSGSERSDWLEAFGHHPKIGDRDSLRQRFARTAHLSEREQAGVDGASEDVLDGARRRQPRV